MLDLRSSSITRRFGTPHKQFNDSLIAQIRSVTRFQFKLMSESLDPRFKSGTRSALIGPQQDSLKTN